MKGHLIVCSVCENEFVGRVPHMKTCSKECRKEHHRIYHKRLRGTLEEKQRSCEICSKPFAPKRKDSSCCSKKCKYRRNYLKKKEKDSFETECAQCGEAFIAVKKGTKLCSIACINRFTANPPVKKDCEWCDAEFEVPYIKRQRRFCSKSCSTSHNNENRDEDAVRSKISETKRKQYASGEVIHPFLGRTLTKEHKDKISTTRIERGVAKGEKNPMFGKQHSKKVKEKMSETRVKKILNGEYDYSFHGGAHYSSKLKREVVYRSSWEETVYKILDRDPSVITYVAEPYSIDYKFDQGRKYIPDIHIVYSDGTQKLIEIKPEYFVSAKINQAKFKAAKEYCDKRNIIFEVWTEKTIEQMTIYKEQEK